MKRLTSIRRSLPCCPGLTELVVMSTVASVRLSDTPALSSERECDEGSGDGNASVGKADLEFW